MKKISLMLSTIIISVSLSACSNTQPDHNLKNPVINSTLIDESPQKTEDISSPNEVYEVIEVSPCNLSGHREPNVKVDIGYGDREYWAYTNEYGQLIRVEAKEIILQNEKTEHVTPEGRYCKDEAKVPGVEDPDLDEGHVIADSLGGVSNAYNITPQNSTLNRHGDQAYMEKSIREAGGCTDFVAIITYPDTNTQIPSHYKYTYTLRGNKVTDEFDNVNPDSVNGDSVTTIQNTSQNTDNVPIFTNVWISETGKKYHNQPDCGQMNPDFATKISKKDAESKGYTPCKKCFK